MQGRKTGFSFSIGKRSIEQFQNYIIEKEWIPAKFLDPSLKCVGGGGQTDNISC